MNEGVTIVIPYYNRAKYLPRMLTSLEKVNYPSLHVILVDNGSTDESARICNDFANGTSLDITLTKEERKGANAARNKGLKLCTTPYIYFFDSDDELSPDFLTKVMPNVKDADVLFFPTRQQIGNKTIIRSYNKKVTVELQILNGMFNTQSLLWNTEFLRKIGGWNEDLMVWQDWELGTRMVLNNPKIVYYTSEAFHTIYVHKDSITGSSMLHNLKERVATMKTVWDIQNPSISYHKAIYYRAMILEGMLRREKTLLPIAESFVDKRFSNSTYKIGKGLRTYVSKGGRGAWYIAYLVV